MLFDGTLWRDDEMVALGLGLKTGQRMGHMSVSGPDGTVAAFRDLPVKRRILIHINNSNPILLDESAERIAVEKEGWTRYDGMEVSHECRFEGAIACCAPDELEAALRAIGARALPSSFIRSTACCTTAS